MKVGYVALLVDSFTPRNAPQNQCGIGSVVVSEVNERPHDAYAGLIYLMSKSYVDPNKVGLLGWSHGGSAAMSSMDVSKFHGSLNFKIAVTFYPGCGLYNAFGGVSTSMWKPYAPFVVLIGSADTVISPTNCQIRLSRAQTLGASGTSLGIFPNAHHSFDLARSVTTTFTQDDVNAKTAFDPLAMQIFAAFLH